MQLSTAFTNYVLAANISLLKAADPSNTIGMAINKSSNPSQLESTVISFPSLCRIRAHISILPGLLFALLTFNDKPVDKVRAEAIQIDGAIVRQDGTPVDVEPDRLFPLAKGADVANDRVRDSVRRLLVPQRSMNEDTSHLKQQHPKTYRYLDRHHDAFAARKSSIYRGRDRFALFGIGPYTFTPYKVAICGLYKRLQFTLVGPIKGQPVVMDDTCYFLSFKTKRQAACVLELLTSDLATEFFQARIFWDAKRPINAEVLRRLDLKKLAAELECESEYQKLFPVRTTCN